MDSRKELVLEYLERRPAAAARVLEQQTIDQSIQILSELPSRIVGPVIKSMLPHYAIKCLAQFNVEHAVAIIQRLSTHRGASLLRGMSQTRRDAIVGQLSQVKASSIRFLLGQGNNVVGGWVDQHAFTLPPEIAVADARQRLRQWQQIDAHRLFVVGENNQLFGAIPLARLLQAEDQQRIQTLVEPVKTLRTRASLHVAEQHKDWLNHLEMPVLDRHDEFVGIMTYNLLNHALRTLRPYNSELQMAEESFNTLASIFINSFNYTWQSWIELISIPYEQQGDDYEQPTGRNRSA